MGGTALVDLQAHRIPLLMIQTPIGLAPETPRTKGLKHIYYLHPTAQLSLRK